MGFRKIARLIALRFSENQWLSGFKTIGFWETIPETCFRHPIRGNYSFSFPVSFPSGWKLHQKKLEPSENGRFQLKPGSIVALHSALQIRSAYDVFHANAERF
jgi:hypothetical protein